MGFGLGGREGELDVAMSVWGCTLFVGPVEGSIGSFGRCVVSSSVRIMLEREDVRVGGGDNRVLWYYI